MADIIGRLKLLGEVIAERASAGASVKNAPLAGVAVRGAMLTRLLQNGLTGDAKIVLIVHIHPGLADADESCCPSADRIQRCLSFV